MGAAGPPVSGNCFPIRSNRKVDATPRESELLKYHAAHKNVLLSEQRARERFVASRTTEAAGTDAGTRQRRAPRVWDGPERASSPWRQELSPVPLVTTIKCSPSRPMRVTESRVASAKAMLSGKFEEAGSCAPPAALVPTAPAAALPMPLNLAPTEAALARCEAAVAAARTGEGPSGRPSRERVEAAAAQLAEAKQACAALRGEVHASMTNLRAELESDVNAAFAAQGWAPHFRPCSTCVRIFAFLGIPVFTPLAR